MHALALRCGFRRSYSRDALVLRRVGDRWGPVLKLDLDASLSERVAAERAAATAAAAQAAEPAAPGSIVTRASSAAAPAAALLTGAWPLPDLAARPAERIVDLACLPLAPTRSRWAPQLWQLTAVDLEVGYVWAELAGTRGQPPEPEVSGGFVQRIAEELAAVGLRLDAIVVPAVGPRQRSSFPPAPGVRLLRVPPRVRREQLAARTHDQLVAAYWRRVLAEQAGHSLQELQRGLSAWIEARNHALPGGGGEGAELSPAAALRMRASRVPDAAAKRARQVDHSGR